MASTAASSMRRFQKTWITSARRWFSGSAKQSERMVWLSAISRPRRRTNLVMRCSLARRASRREARRPSVLARARSASLRPLRPRRRFCTDTTAASMAESSRSSSWSKRCSSSSARSLDRCSSRRRCSWRAEAILRHSRASFHAASATVMMHAPVMPKTRPYTQGLSRMASALKSERASAASSAEKVLTEKSRTSSSSSSAESGTE
mmetsp:Transcript_22532/g.70578  ORF Transcript_22532/g.70578 Transcript_22532/m.70578 type:complete len:206 (-) Transcript_22532:195-812(-)